MDDYKCFNKGNAVAIKEWVTATNFLKERNTMLRKKSNVCNCSWEQVLVSFLDSFLNHSHLL